MSSSAKSALVLRAEVLCDEVLRHEFLDSLDTIVIESDSEVEEVHELTFEDLDKDLGFLDESSSDDDVKFLKRVDKKTSKKRFTKKRKVKEAVVPYIRKEANNNSCCKRKTTQGREEIPDSRQSNHENKNSRQCNWSSQPLTDAMLPLGWRMCFEKTHVDGKVVMVAAYEDPNGEVFRRDKNGFSNDLLELFKSYSVCEFFLQCCCQP